MFFSKNSKEKLASVLIEVNEIKRTVNSFSERIESTAFHAYHGYYFLKEILKNQILLSGDFIRMMNVNKIKLNLNSDYTIAEDSNDCLFPESTMDGAIRKPSFTNKIKQLFAECSLLDIGCGGGGIVYDALLKGITAYGIDGSDQNKKRGSGYWAVDEGNLLTCDATKPYNFSSENGIPFKFKMISSWECMEHIPENLVQGFLSNVYNNLADDGYFIGSISRMPYFNEKTGVIYHVTLQDENWWKAKFSDANLIMLDIDKSPFVVTDFCRGIGFDWQDMHTDYINNPENGFLFVAKKG